MNRLFWRILDWIYSKDESLIIVDENNKYSLDWDEISCLPEFILGKLRCKIFNVHGLPFMGSCVYCLKDLKPGDHIGWFELYDPENNWSHGFLENPFQILPEVFRLGAEYRIRKAYEDADALYKESHK